MSEDERCQTTPSPDVDSPSFVTFMVICFLLGVLAGICFMGVIEWWIFP